MTVISLVPPPPPEPADKRIMSGIMQNLDVTLERVRSGETVTIAIVEVAKDGGVYSHWSEPSSAHALLGAIERLKHKLLAEMDKP